MNRNRNINDLEFDECIIARLRIDNNDIEKLNN
jgi:hypothetical protein